MNDNFVFPDYINSLLNIPHTILSHFGIPTVKLPLSKTTTENIEGSRNLVLFLIDGFGFNVYERIAVKNNFFKLFSKNGKVSKITSVFPATTAAALTTLHSGQAPIEHGFFEWNLYFPAIEEIIESLPYQLIPTEFTDPNVTLPQDTSLIFNGKTIYEELKKNKVGSAIFLPEGISRSIYSGATSKGAMVIGYKDLSDLLIRLVTVLKESKSKLYCYVYYDRIDTAEHVYGVWSEEAKREVEDLSKHLEKDFLRKFTGEVAENTGILFTADHGQEDIDLENPTLLNNFSFLTESYKLNSRENSILPSGSPRDIFLNVKEDKLDKVITSLDRKLKDKSVVLKLDEKTIKTLFGNFTPHKEFMDRLGNILILSKKSHACWYKYNDESKLALKGHHGSLLKSEMILPFGSAKISDLIH